MSLLSDAFPTWRLTDSSTMTLADQSTTHHLSLFHATVESHYHLFWILCNLALLSLWGLNAVHVSGFFAPQSDILESPSRPRNRMWPMLLASLVLLFLLRIPSLTRYSCNVDEDEWLACALALQDDPVFWRSTQAHTSGPLVIYALQPLTWLGLPLSYGSANATTLFLHIMICVCTACTLYRALAATIATRLSLAFTSVYALVTSQAFVGYNGETVTVAMLSLCALLACYAARGSHFTFGATLHAFGLGVTLGIVPYCKLQAVPAAIGIGLGVILMYRSVWWSALVICASLVPTVIVSLLLSRYDLLGTAISDYLVDNALHAQNATQLTWYARLASLPLMIRQDAQELRMFLVVTLCASLWLLCAVAVNRVSLFQECSWRPVIWLWYFLGSCYGVVQTGSGNDHYLMLLLHPAMLLASSVHELLPKIKCAITVQHLFAAGVFWAISYMAISWQMNYVKQTPVRKQEAVGAVAAVIHADKTSSASTLVVWGWEPRLYVESGLKPGTRWSHTLWAILDGPEGGRHLEGFVGAMANSKPSYFIDATDTDSKYFQNDRYRHERYPLLEELITKDYEFVCTTDGARIFRRRDAGWQ